MLSRARRTRHKLLDWQEDAGSSLLLIAISLPVVLLVYPVAAPFRRNSPRFKKLMNLRMDELCAEIQRGGDFDFREREEEPRASERELQKIAHHLGFKSAVGAVNDPEYSTGLKTIFAKNGFWIYRNGYTERRGEIGLAMGFWLGVAATAIAAWLIP